MFTSPLKQALSVMVAALVTGLPVFSHGNETPANIVPLLESNNVRWDVPGPTSAESMPIGNGDIGLNVWVEPNGDLLFFISKTDSWAEDVKGSRGLLKLTKVRVSMNPSPLVSGVPFRQVLKLHEGEIVVNEGPSEFRVWVDANHPVIRVETKSGTPAAVSVSIEPWRTAPAGRISADTILPAQNHRIAWYHRNGEKSDPQVLNLTSGGVIQGAGLVSKDATTLQTTAPVTSQLISIYPLTATTDTPEEWTAKLDRQIAQIDAINLEQTRNEHRQWWDRFWNRSWVFVEGDELAKNVTQGYLLQRFVTACAGRGAYPIKFNGSIFVVDHPALNQGKDKATGQDKFESVSADYRTWGGQYWFQNTRAMYWPRLASGDFEMMLPLFKMYAAQVPSNAALVKQYYGHDGAYFAETAPFWGGMSYVGPEVPENFTAHYFTPILEISMMMLDYYEYTGDKSFVKETLLPVATAGLTFFDKHFGRDAQGKLLLDPDNAIEMYWKVRNPAPDIAALTAILNRLLALPGDLVSASQRADWQRFRQEIPELPVGTRNNKQTLLPYTGEQTAKRRNGENPELYALFPFRLYGLEKPGYDLILRTYNSRTCKQKGCWVQDPIQAAMLGLTDEAKDYVSYALTRKEPGLKFPAFWARGCDYMPDQDNGGNGENGLQQMLLQAEGKKILVLPAWPKGWNAEFKLNAPYQTTVQGKVENGKLVNLVVTPASRQADIIDMTGRDLSKEADRPVIAANGSVYNILTSLSLIAPLKQTAKGKPNILVDEAESNPSQGVDKAIDGNLNSKYFNRSKNNVGDPAGVGSGFAVAIRGDSACVTGIRIATANDMPDRDPLSITVEGSNDPNAGETGGNGYTLLYEGPTGLESIQERTQWGPAIAIKNSTAYKTYRVLVTETRGDNTSATQYSEVQLGTFVPGPK